MASKKDLVEAQSFARRRLLTAFVSGAPGGRELEPTKPMRAVVTGVLLSVLVVLAGVVTRMLNPGLPAGWDNNRLIVADSGARYVSVQGTLYPVLNLTSARLLVPSDFAVVKAKDAKLANVPRGATVGIPGAPDALPLPDALVGDGWLSCIDGDGARTTILSNGPVARAVGAEQAAIDRAVASNEQAPPAVLVEVEGQEYLVAEGRRHLVPQESRDAVLRALALATAQPWPVSGDWLSLFPPGADLEALLLPGAGEELPMGVGAPPGAKVGAVLRVTDVPTAGVAAWVIDAEGKLSPLSDVALNLYRLGSGTRVGPDIETTGAQIAGLATGDTFAPKDWPSALPEIATTDAVCARLSTAGVLDGDAPVQLVPTEQQVIAGEGNHVYVDGNAGAIVQPIAGGADAVGWVNLIDASGTAFPVPSNPDIVITRLGYTVEQVVRVPQEWLRLFATGPALSVEAAGTAHTAGSVPTPASAVADTGRDADTEGADDVTADATREACERGTRRLIPDRPPAHALLGADGAWSLATGDGVVVAVVDSGVAAANEHLTDAVLPGYDLVGSTSGLVDEDSHGTAVAGIIAAREVEGSGLTGLAYDATIVPVRIFVDTSQDSKDAGLGPRDDRLAEGIRRAVDSGAKIINVSLSSLTDKPDLAAAVRYANDSGALIVASAGNVERDQPTTGPRYPAAYPGVLGVTAVDATGAPSPAVVQGEHVDIAAPGQYVLTAYYADGDCVLAGDNPKTSFATAYVSAAAALVAQRYPDETPEQWAHRLMVTAARPIANERSDQLGWGVVRPRAALTFVDDGSAPGPESPVYEPPPPPEAPAPVTASPVADPTEQTRAAAVWWLLAAGVAGSAAALLGVPMRRRRRRPKVSAVTTTRAPRRSSGAA